MGERAGREYAPPTLRSRVLQSAALAAILCLSACSFQPTTTVYRGGPIVTMDAGDRIVEALGVRGDRIGAVGSEAEVLAWAGPDARIVDLGGRTLVPGFIDAHGHFPGEGVWSRVEDLSPPPIGGVDTLDDLIARLAKRAERTDADSFVLGMGYDDTLLAEGRHPNRHDLDRVSTEQPVIAVHISGHLAAVNSRALEIFGIDASTPDPDGGRIRREADGSPDGVLEERAMTEASAQLTGTPSPLDAIAIVREASRRAASVGITTAQSGLFPEALLPMVWLARLGIIPIRLVLWPDPALADRALSGDVELTSFDPDRVRFGAVKLVADGSLQALTGYLTEPYHRTGEHPPDFRGYPVIEREELARLVERYHEAGFQVAVHGNGDASIDDVLDAFEAAQAAHPREDARPIVIHAQTARPDQLDRMRDLGVIPSFFGLHVYYWGDRHRDLFLGPERAARISPARSAEQRGIPFTLHSDAPVVPMDPLLMLHVAVNRETSSGQPLGPAERIDVLAAMRAITIDAARQHFEEERKGSLEPGKLADFVILSGSPFDDPTRIDELQVLETYVGGKRVYRAGAAARSEP